MPPFRPARLAILFASAFLAGGCSMWGFGEEELETAATTSRPAVTANSSPASTPATAAPPTPSETVEPATSIAVASTEPPKEGEIDVRRYLGPNYCPELRVLSGAELMRTYERGHEDDMKYVVWQASVGKTARECLWDLQGGLTLKIGISGRVIAGPKGGVSTVSVPLKVAVVKHKEAVLADEKIPLDVAIPANGSAVFTQVKDILVPSPGENRDYIIYLGFDVGEWDLMNGVVEMPAVAVVDEPLPPVEEPPPAPPEPTTPKELPVPDDGFVLQ